MGKIKVHKLVLLMALALGACRKDGDAPNPEYPTGTDAYINNWMLDSLRRYYYWNEQLPASPDMEVDPRGFLAAVRDAADRFSYTLLPSDPATYPANNKQFGFDYATIEDAQSGEVIGIVKLVLADSPASRAGLKRGDYIATINGHRITATNAETLQEQVLNGDGFTLGMAIRDGNTWKETHTLELSAGVILDQHAVSQLFEQDGQKVGYLYFEGFNPGLAASLMPAFTAFKSAGISGLILDLRYNGGGQVSEAAGLCALIAPGINHETPFITFRGNRNGGVNTLSFGKASTFDGTADFGALLDHNLALNRLYVLGTAATASASEVVINNLKPYMEVYLVGQCTMGKDVASFAITDLRTPKLVQWELHPIIYKLANAAGQGDYSTGIAADLEVDELADLPLKPLGDPADPMIAAALGHMGIIPVRSGVSRKAALARDATGPVVLTDSRVRRVWRSVVITGPMTGR